MALQQKSTPLTWDLQAADLARVATEAWCSFDTSELTVSSNTVDAGHTDAAFTASVAIEGNWKGIVRLNCPLDLATEVAAGIFGEQDDETAEACAMDMLGEITNMIAGSVAQIIDSATQLSLPEVGLTQGNDIESRDNTIIAEVALNRESKTIQLRLLSN